MGFEWLFGPVEHADEWLTGLFDGVPLLVALLIALALGLRHASDPDHLVAVTSLMASEDADTRAAARLGAWWGAGHAATLLLIGAPLILFRSELPLWLERGAEKAVGGPGRWLRWWSSRPCRCCPWRPAPAGSPGS